MHASLLVLGLAIAGALDDRSEAGSAAAPEQPAAVDVRQWLPLLNTEVLVEMKDGGFFAGLLEGMSPSEVRLRLVDGTTRTVQPWDVVRLTAKPGASPPAAVASPATKAPVDRPSKTVSGPPERLLELLVGKQVTVRANDDVRVRGRLLSFDDDSIEIDSERGRFEIERSAVTRIEEPSRAGRTASRVHLDGDDPMPQRESSAEKAARSDVATHAANSQMWFVGGAVSAGVGLALCGVWLFVCATPYVLVPGVALLCAGVVEGGIGALELGAASAAEKRAAAEQPRMAY
ncbi:MAG: hypothetical protein HYS27_26920 [Deltaproteobacteria bacterium]|nr:hypothetical protein [Deltaproteobacteria bacterium]